MTDFTLNAPGTVDDPWMPEGVFYRCKTPPAGSVFSFAASIPPIPAYPGCSLGGATSYGMDNGTPFFHAGHGPTEPCKWIVTPEYVRNQLKPDDLLRAEVSDDVMRWYLNDVEVNEHE